MNMRVKSKKILTKGYTLIELLIVMAMIGALASASIVIVPKYVKRARDTQRISDMKQYQTLMEKYANANSGLYPQRDSNSEGGNDINNLCGDLGVSDCVEDPKDGENICDTNTCNYFVRTNNCGGTTIAGEACATFYILFTPLEVPKSDHYYWGICSTGKSGEFTSTNIPEDLDASTTCPI